MYIILCYDTNKLVKMVFFYEIRHIHNQYILVPKTPMKSIHQMITLNASGFFIFSQLESTLSIEDTIDIFKKTYGLSHEQATHDVTIFIESLESQGIMDASV